MIAEAACWVSCATLGRDRAGLRRRAERRAGSGRAAGGLDHVRHHRRRRAEPALAAINHGGTIAFAYKEALVSAGDVFLRAVGEAGATLLPVDSEHNAIMQAMADGNEVRGKDHPHRLGGAVPQSHLEEMRAVTPEAALRHPVWSMGAKISIDSATMMNKGLEVIEAARLFSLPSEKIEVLMHPQSVIHGMVCYADGSVLAQLGSPDMRIPIAHSLAWPSVCPPARRGSIWPPWRGWISSRPTRRASRRCAWRVRPWWPAPARRRC